MQNVDPFRSLAGVEFLHQTFKYCSGGSFRGLCWNCCKECMFAGAHKSVRFPSNPTTINVASQEPDDI
jgi:hypothetical protein